MFWRSFKKSLQFFVGVNMSKTTTKSENKILTHRICVWCPIYVLLHLDDLHAKYTIHESYQVNLGSFGWVIGRATLVGSWL